MKKSQNKRETKQLKEKLKKLFDKKRLIIDILLTINTAYSQIDDMFAREIIIAEIMKKNKFKLILNDIFSFLLIPFQCCFKNKDLICVPTQLIEIINKKTLLDKIRSGNISEIYKSLGIDDFKKNKCIFEEKIGKN